MRYVFLSRKAAGALRRRLERDGFRILDVADLPSVDPAVASHPDIRVCSLPGRVVLEPGLFDALGAAGSLPWDGGAFAALRGERRPAGAYPADCPYNGVQVGRFFLHHLKHTDTVLLRQVAALGLEPVQIRQGYAKCSVCVAGDGIITADGGIAAAARRHGIGTLLIRPGHVRLPGHPYGFLGGASGRIGDRIVFNGDLSAHPDFPAIIRFIADRGLEPLYFKDIPLEDIGSVIAAGDASKGGPL